MGGGSSNAAAVLLALPVLLGKPLETEILMELGAELGSDVPFFLVGGTAAGLGRGTELYPLLDVPNVPGLVIAPGIHSSTTEAYRALDRPIGSAAPADMIKEFQSVVWHIAHGPGGSAEPAWTTSRNSARWPGFPFART